MFAFASSASAEPMFLAKQYTRCTACHYSPTGGGLLTPYGRLLSHRELSTTGASAAAAAPRGEAVRRGERRGRKTIHMASRRSFTARSATRSVRFILVWRCGHRI